nr:hypothetical protein [Tanacetum cinerariifolium]
MLRGGFCFPCNFKAENSFNCYRNAYSFNDLSNNSNYLPQPQYENYLCNLCGNNSHDGYDCQQQFSFVYEQKPSYNKNYDEKSDEVFQANYSVQYKENLENSSDSNEEKEEPPQESDIHQLIRKECYVEASEEQKQSMEDTMLELVKICQEKEFLCIHDDVDDLIESSLNSKLLLINSNSQRLDKKEQEVKNVVEQPAERENRNIQSLQNFRVVHKSSISSNTSQISSIHAIAPVLSTKEPEHLLSIGYEHLSITLETESDEVTESNAENLLPIPSECEVTLEDKREYIKYVEASLSDPEIISVEGDNDVEEENVVQHEEEEVDLEDISQIQDVVLQETRSGNTTHADNSLTEYDSFCFEIEPDQERLINLMKNDIPDNSSNKSLLEEVVLFLSDNSIPPGIENFADDPKDDIHFLEELLINDSILSHESSDSNFKDNPSILRPPLELPDAETNIEEEIPVVMNDKDKFDYHFFMFDKVFSLLSAESEDTIFDHGKDCAQFVKKQPKTRQYQHKFRKQKKKPDQEAVF